jgi:hypothetical protein
MSHGRDPLRESDLHGVSVPLEVIPSPAVSARDVPEKPLGAGDKIYSPERQRDRVRLVVAVGLLTILGYVVVFSTFEASSYPAHWSQTKEMLQIILPALTGVIGTVIGFYFGTSTANKGQGSDE